MVSIDAWVSIKKIEVIESVMNDNINFDQEVDSCEAAILACERLKSDQIKRKSRSLKVPLIT